MGLEAGSLCLPLLLLQCVLGTWGRSFVIDYANNQFLKDGQPFRYISGSMHYFRVPAELWEDRMIKMRAAGLDAVQTYVEWKSHETQPGVYDFTGDNDLVRFLQTAEKVGLLVVLRPGPYIDAERDMGGLPSWLLKVNKNMKLRSNDPSFLAPVKSWFDVLFPLIRPHLYENNGSIISVQVENEYGSYGACDFQYTAFLRDLTRHHLGNSVVLFTTDGPADPTLSCGKVDGVFTGVDFGTGVNVSRVFNTQRLHQEKGPLINSEFYPGWLDHWGYSHSTVDTKEVVKYLDQILAMKASVNIYMFHGGTSFGFGSGSNLSPNFQACPTSYDYDAPLNEAGDPTDKYYSIRDTIAKYNPLPPIPVPVPKPKMNIPNVQLNMVASLLDIYEYLTSINSVYPLTFEDMYLDHGLVFYTTRVSFHAHDPVLLTVKGIRDRGYVYVDKKYQGILSRERDITSLPVTIRPGQNLTILVENQGRVCFGSGINDFKGIVGNVTLGSQVLANWSAFIFNPEKTFSVDYNSYVSPSCAISPCPFVYKGQFDIPDQYPEILDSFLSLKGWGKGFVRLNDRILGRHWPIEGPQVTLYAPSPFFLKNSNEIYVLELEEVPDPPVIHFVSQPIINGSTPLG
ncbi:GLB1L [Cordylochernes scorpioides]|uniref:GLB1L n=1 Tax=Cordylochernes scorpioides TaxID=51811 RepID=A0ABY6KP39_9ARAC|nr:GLB1L [Cordylochernes scorpioides]